MVLLDVDHSHMAVPAVYTEYGKLHRKWRGASVRSKNRSVRVPRAYSRTQAKLKAHVPHYEKYGNPIGTVDCSTIIVSMKLYMYTIQSKITVSPVSKEENSTPTR